MALWSRIMRIARVFLDAYREFDADDGWAIASHIALSVLTSVFPFLIFVTALAGSIGARDFADSAAELLFDQWPPRIAAPIAAEIHNVLTRSRSDLLTIGGLLALFFSAKGVGALRIGLDRAYDVYDTRPWWLLRIEAVLFVALGACALIALAILLVFAPLAWKWATHFTPAIVETLAPLYAPVRFGVSTTIFLVILVICHKYLPAGRRSLRMIAPGVVLTLVAWMAFGAAFGAYLAEFSNNYVSTYAGLASIMIALIFLYSLGAIFMFGAELNWVLANGETKKTPRLSAL